MNLQVNGDPRRLEPASSPASLVSVIEALGQDPRVVVVEHNGLIVPRSQWEATSVCDGDTLEIVTIVGGGS